MSPKASQPPAKISRKALLVTFGFLLGNVIDDVWARLVRGFRLQREDHPKFVVGSFRVHHNVFGYLSILVGVVISPALLIPLGVGMIMGHRRRDRLFWFLERIEPEGRLRPPSGRSHADGSMRLSPAILER